MNVSLTPELKELVEDKVRSGLYQTASEVVRDALRLLQDRDRFRQIKLERLRRDIAVGIEEADRGEVAALDLDDILEESRKRLANKKKKR
jgi:antitoxin ParD1/3/4